MQHACRRAIARAPPRAAAGLGAQPPALISRTSSPSTEKQPLGSPGPTSRTATTSSVSPRHRSGLVTGVSGAKPTSAHPGPQELPDLPGGLGCLGGAEQELVDVRQALADLQGDVGPGVGCRGGQAFGIAEQQVGRADLDQQRRSRPGRRTAARPGASWGQPRPGSRRRTERAWRGWRSDPARRARSSRPPSWSGPPSGTSVRRPPARPPRVTGGHEQRDSEPSAGDLPGHRK